MVRLAEIVCIHKQGNYDRFTATKSIGHIYMNNLQKKTKKTMGTYELIVANSELEAL